MKKCLGCGKPCALAKSTCSACRSGPIILGEFPMYAPDLAHAGGGFEEAYFEELARLEAGNFWFRARNHLIIWVLRQYAPSQFHSMLEIGCGTGYVLSGLSREFPGVKFQGAELFVTGLAFARARLPTVNFMQMDARHIPFEREFDAIGAFDVLEHIDEDTIVLAQIHDALNPEGLLLLTVPQHHWLWSRIDEYAHHVRRYSVQKLHDKLSVAGFQVLRSTSFVSALLPFMCLSRFLKKNTTDDFDPMAELKMVPWMNRLLELVMGIERFLIRKGINFSLGGSRLVVARKV